MTAPFAASFIDVLLGLQSADEQDDADNRVSLEGLSVSPVESGVVEIRARKVEAAALRYGVGPLLLQFGRAALHRLVAQVRIDAGKPRLGGLAAERAELSEVKVEGSLIRSRPIRQELPAGHAPGGARPSTELTAGSWSLGPLAAADGTIRAEIVDAHLLFDADVTIPIRQGGIDFNQATVEHVGPDSRMGVSRLGLYVDAPHGRSYLYQFSSTPVAGVAYERRGALPGPWVPDRGNLRLQPFIEGLLGHVQRGQGLGFTEQARLLLDRTAISGDLQLADGRFSAPGVQADMTGRAGGRNLVRLHSDAVGRGLTVDIGSLGLRGAAWNGMQAELHGDAIDATLKLRLWTDGGALRFAFGLSALNIQGLRLHLDPLPATSAPS